jgi:hypothetical protein
MRQTSGIASLQAVRQSLNSTTRDCPRAVVPSRHDLLLDVMAPWEEVTSSRADQRPAGHACLLSQRPMSPPPAFAASQRAPGVFMGGKRGTIYAIGREIRIGCRESESGSGSVPAPIAPLAPIPTYKHPPNPPISLSLSPALPPPNIVETSAVNLSDSLLIAITLCSPSELLIHSVISVFTVTVIDPLNNVRIDDRSGEQQTDGASGGVRGYLPGVKVARVVSRRRMKVRTRGTSGVSG